MEIGESWAYRARGVDPLVEVRVERVGKNNPARVLVQFISDEFEGRQEWVPPARLKVPWGRVEDFVAREQRWKRLETVGPDRDDPRSDAARTVLELLVREEVAELHFQDGSPLAIKQPGVLATELDLDEKQFGDHPDAFVEDGVVWAPWKVTELVVRAAAQRNSDRILQHVAAEERKAHYEAIHGHYLPPSRGEAIYISPEHSVEFDREYLQPQREVLRAWCGVEAVERVDELVELRKEIKRVGDVAESAIEALHRAGEDAHAAQLRRELGTPVEMLRTDRSGS